LGDNPGALAFDGANIWVANFTDGTVNKLLASTGALLGTFSVGAGPDGLAFDGANIWVANENSDTMGKL
jgi:DNA-binding beta-propeller fold protein YncE